MALKNDGKVTIGTDLDNSGLEKGINSISGSMGGLKSVLGKIGGLIGVAFAVQKVVQFGAACIELGSSVTEVQNVVDTAFGGMAYKMEDFSQTAITQFGMSELAAKKTGSTYMAMARGMGMNEDAASDMAISLTGLTGDVASFFNISQEMADVKLKSVFTGETESLKDLGVVMTQTNLQQYAMEHGMNSNIAAMSQAEQVSLRYAYVTNALSLASGDFAKTQDSWANQTRILSMQWQQFMAIIGKALTTVLLPVVKILNAIVSALINMANTFSAAITAIFGGQSKQIKAGASGAGTLAAANTVVADSAQTAAEGENALAGSTKKAGKEAKKSLAAFDELTQLQDNSGDSGGGAGTGGSGAGGADLAQSIGTTAAETQVSGLADAIRQFWQVFTALLAPSITAWSEAWTQIKSTAMAVWPGIQQAAQGLWNNALLPLLGYLGQTFVPGVVNAFSNAFAPIVGGAISAWIRIFADFFIWACTLISDAVNTVVIPALDVLLTIWQGLMDGLKVAWDTYGQPIMDGLVLAFQNLEIIFTTLWEVVIKPVLTNLIDAIDRLWEQHLKPLWDDITALVGAVGLLILDLWNTALAPIVNWLVATFGPMFTQVFNAVAGAVEAAVGFISDAIDIVVTVFKGIIEFLTAVFQGDWDGAWNAIGRTVSDVWDKIQGTVKSAINGIIGFVNGMANAVAAGINGVIDALNALHWDAPAWLTDLTGMTSFGFNVQHVTPPQIPLLARGAVLPANKPFAAIVGDQKNGTNVEAPLGVIQEAVANIMGDITDANMAGYEAIVNALRDILEAVYGIRIGDEVIGRAAARYEERLAVMQGGF